MTATDQLRAALRDLEAKARQAELDKKIETFADQADRFLRTAAARAGEFAAENRDRIDAKLAEAGASVDSRTDGKYHSYVDRVRSGLLSGVDWVAEQRGAAEGQDAASDSPASDSPASASPASASSGRAAAAPSTATPGTADELGDEGITAEGAWAATTDTATATDPVTEDPQASQDPPAPTDR